MHDRDRRADGRHMGFGERPPAAADGIEHGIGQRGRQAIGQHRVDAALGVIDALLQQRLDRQGAERQADPALADVIVQRLGHLQAAAAHVADEAHRSEEPRDHAEGRETGLLGATEDPDGEAALGRDRGREIGTVAGPPHRFGGGRVDPLDPHGVRYGPEASHRLDGPAEVLGRDGPRLGQALAEAAQGFLVEARQRRPGQFVVDDEADGVRADIDDPVMRAIHAAGPIRLEIQGSRDLVRDGCARPHALLLRIDPALRSRTCGSASQIHAGLNP